MRGIQQKSLLQEAMPQKFHFFRWGWPAKMPFTISQSIARPKVLPYELGDKLPL